MSRSPSGAGRRGRPGECGAGATWGLGAPGPLGPRAAGPRGYATSFSHGLTGLKGAKACLGRDRKPVGDPARFGQVPVLLVGGLGRTRATGRVLDYTWRGDDNRKLCSLYQALRRRMAVAAVRFGDATGQLAGL